MSLKLPPGFSCDWSGRDSASIGIYGPQGSGKTRLAATAYEWSKERGCTPGWIVLDRKTRKTVRDYCAEMGYPLPVINSTDYIDPKTALQLATSTADADKQQVYTKATNKVFADAVALGEMKEIDPIIIDSASNLWDWIAFAHFGKKQDAGKARVWGPPKQDWTDLLDGLSHKTIIVTLHSKDEWANDKPTGRYIPEGPPHLGYTTTSLVRLVQKPAKSTNYVDRFRLDVVESQDNKGLEGVEGVLEGDSITFSNLMMRLRPE